MAGRLMRWRLKPSQAMPSHPMPSHPMPPRRGALAPVVALLIVLGHALALLALQRGFDGARALAPTRPAPVRVTLLTEPVAPVPERAQAAPAPAVPRARPPAPEPAAPAPAPETPMPPSSPAPAEALAAGSEGGSAVPPPESAIAAGALAATEAAPAGGPPSAAVAAEAGVGAGSASGAAPPASAVAAASPVPPSGAPLPAPQPARIRFRVHYGDYASRHSVAVLEYQVEAADGRYQLRTEGRAEGLTALFYSGVLTQTSTGGYGDEGLQPERHTEQRGRGGLRWAALDAATGQARFSGGQRASAPPGTQDRLSMLIQLGLIARGRPSLLAPGMTLSLPELGSRSVDTVAYRSLGDETLATDEGPVRALRLTRHDGDPARDPRIDIWLGYDQHLLPVRIRLTDPGGRVLDQILVR
jgi:hypothetical protein